MFEQVSPDAPPSSRRWLPGLGAWVVGTLVAAPLVLAGWSAWLIANPQLLVHAAERWAMPAGAHVYADRFDFEAPDGLLSPSTWVWQVSNLGLWGAAPDAPVVLVNRATIRVPRITPTLGLGLHVAVPRVDVDALTLWWPTRKTPKPLSWSYNVLEWIGIEQATVQTFDLLMAKHEQQPELMVLAKVIHLDDWGIEPRKRWMYGVGVVPDAQVEVAGVRFDKVYSDSVRFNGPGLAAHITAVFGQSDMIIDLDVTPIMGPPLVTMDARMDKGNVAAIAQGITAVAPDFLDAVATIDVHLQAGKPLPGQSTLRGTATVNVTDIEIRLPPEVGAGPRVGIALAPFLTIQDGVVGVPRIHGNLSFTSSSLSFNDLKLEADHTTGHLDGRIASTDVHARLDMQPRPGHGAVRFGLVVGGKINKPDIQLAFGPKLDAWEP